MINVRSRNLLGFVLLIQIVGFTVAEACQLRPLAEVGSVHVYSKPTDDSERGDAGSLSTIYRDNHEYNCLEVTADGWVHLNHGWRADDNSPRTYNSWAPISAFTGNIQVTDGRGSSPDTIFQYPGGGVHSPQRLQTPPAPGEPPVSGNPLTLDRVPRPQTRPADVPTIGTSESFTDFFTRVAERGEHARDGYRYELPMAPEQGVIPPSVSGMTQQGPCGGLHIRSQRTNPHMNPTTACLFAAASQEWQKTHCPNNGPNCRIIYGDAGHDGSPTVWPHASHNDGQCIDLWPMRQNLRSLRTLDMSPTAVEPSQFTRNHANYSSERTSQFTEILMRWGVEDSGASRQFFFNDPALIEDHGYRELAAHDEHMHVCFRNNEANRELCRQFRRDPNICHFNQPEPAQESDDPSGDDRSPSDSIL